MTLHEEAKLIWPSAYIAADWHTLQTGSTRGSEFESNATRSERYRYQASSREWQQADEQKAPAKLTANLHFDWRQSLLLLPFAGTARTALAFDCDALAAVHLASLGPPLAHQPI